MRQATGAAPHLSIAPGRTLLGMAFLAAFSLLLAGCTRAIGERGPRRLVHGITLLGGLVAFVGLAQAAVQPDVVYGFWRAPKLGAPFAPFVNENHYTGWMAMVASLAIGSFAGGVAAALKDVKPGWRNRIVWFSSRRASGMVVTGFAIAVMALSMVVATSRGGLVGLLLIFMIVVMWTLRRQSGWRRIIGVLSLGLITALALGWGDASRTIAQFAGVFEDMGGRKEIWSDTLPVIRDFPLTGTGLNTFGIAMLHYQKAYSFGGAVTEAHNDYLQLAAEGGLLLGVPIVLAIGIMIREIWRRFQEARDAPEIYWIRAGAVTGLCAIAVMELFDFTLQMPGAAAMFVVLVAVAIHQPTDGRSGD
jgi:O-antigen ligase